MVLTSVKVIFHFSGIWYVSINMNVLLMLLYFAKGNFLCHEPTKPRALYKIIINGFLGSYAYWREAN